MQRCAIIGILGAPNAGKSTLINRLAGRKRAIVTHKANTTRKPGRAVVSRGDTQLLLIDTPGMLSSRKPEESGDPQSLSNALEGVDLFLLVVDAARSDNELRRGRIDKSPYFTPLLREVREICRGGKESARVSLVLNKIDLIPKERLLALTASWNRHMAFAESFFVSASKGDGVGDVLSYLEREAAPEPWLYPSGKESDEENSDLASEITREKLLLRLHQEIPYMVAVESECWKRRENGDLHVEQTIFVRFERHRKIVLGKGGGVIRDVSRAARREMTEVFGCPVHLSLRVKPRSGKQSRTRQEPGR